MKFFKHIIVLFLCIMMLFPFLFVLIGASHDSSWAFQSSFDLSWGKDFIKNFLTLKNKYSVGRVLFNSFSSSFLTAGFSVIVMELAAYSVCKFNFKGKQILWSLIIALSIVPQPTYLVGQIETINRLGMYSTFIGLVIPFIINLKILIYLRNINQFIPNEILNAARLDGANEGTVMLKIAFPFILDKLFFAFFVAFIASWNNFLIPMIITKDQTLFTLPILTAAIADPMSYDIGAVFMALLFSVLPIIFLFAFIQRRIFDKAETVDN